MVVVHIHITDLRNFNNLAKLGKTAMLKRKPSLEISTECGMRIRRGISVSGLVSPGSLIFQRLTMQLIQLVMS